VRRLDVEMEETVVVSLGVGAEDSPSLAMRRKGQEEYKGMSRWEQDALALPPSLPPSRRRTYMHHSRIVPYFFIFPRLQ